MNVSVFADSLSDMTRLSRSSRTHSSGHSLGQFALPRISDVMHCFSNVHRSFYLLTIKRHESDNPATYGMSHQAIVICGFLLNYTFLYSDPPMECNMDNSTKNSKKSLDRRSFMRSGLLAGGAATIRACMLANGTLARAQDENDNRGLDAGGIAILRFLAAAELI